MSASREPTAGAAPFRLGYRPWLDGLRGIAVLLVIGYHFRLVEGGWLGVDVFFVLSGFLITALLAQEWDETDSISLPRFYARRALRLLPAFYTLLLLCGAYAWFVQTPETARNTAREIVVAALYLVDYPSWHGVHMIRLGHTWSLSVEEQFYLIWPLMLWLMLRLRLSRAWILTIVVAGIAACQINRLREYIALQQLARAITLYDIIPLYTNLHTRCDSLLVGCLVGLLATWNLLPTGRWFVRLCTLAACGSVAWLVHLFATKNLVAPEFYQGVYTCVAGMVALVLVRLLIAPARPATLLLEWKPLVGVGRISYGLYLFHIPIMRAMKPSCLGFTWDTLLIFAETLLAALLCYFLVERPCLRLKDRFQGNASQSDAPRLRVGRDAPAERVAVVP